MWEEERGERVRVECSFLIFMSGPLEAGGGVCETGDASVPLSPASRTMCAHVLCSTPRMAGRVGQEERPSQDLERQGGEWERLAPA